MLRLTMSFLILGLVFSSISIGDDEAIKKDRKRLEGTWQVTSLTVNGKTSNDDNVMKLTVVDELDGTWIVQSEGKLVTKGTSKLDPKQNPRTIDFTATEGDGKGKQFVGIYQLKKKVRKLCFVEKGKDRPTEFTSTADNQQILVTYKRIKKKK